MKTLLKSAFVATLLLGSAQHAYAQAAAPGSSGTVVAGLGVANVEAVVANSGAFKNAQTQRATTYKSSYDAANNRRTQITAQLQPMADRFNRERQAANASTPAAQASLQQQAQAIQTIQQNAEQELQKILEPVALSEAFVQEQISEKIDQAIQNAMAKKKITLLLTPQTVVAASNSYNLNQDILNELNVLIPNANIVPPAGWEPREVRQQRAAQAAQQGAQRPAAAPATPARPAPGGR